MVSDAAVQACFGLRLLDGATDHVLLPIPLLPIPGNCHTRDVGRVIRATPSTLRRMKLASMIPAFPLNDE